MYRFRRMHFTALWVLKSKIFPVVAIMLPPQVDTGFIINFPFWAP